MTSVDQIVQALTSGRFDNNQLETIARTLKFARAELSREVKKSLQPGAEVKFYHPKLSRDVRGTVERIKLKYVLVRTPDGRYNVPANLLETV